MFCRNCGTQVSENARFCEKCGMSTFSQNIKADEINEQGNNNTVESDHTDQYDWIYSQAEGGIKKNVIDLVQDAFFSKITRIRVIRVTGVQLAMIFKKYFVDTCDDVGEIRRLKIILKLNIMGKKISRNAIICYSKGQNRWIKDCEKKILWEIKTSLFDKEYFAYINNVKQFLEEKESEFQGIPYNRDNFVPVKAKWKLPMAILAVLVWGVVVWSWLTDGGEKSISIDNQNTNPVVQTENTDPNIGQDEKTNSDIDNLSDANIAHEEQGDLGEKISNIAEDDISITDSESVAAENIILEQHDYIYETADAQMEIVLLYTQGEMGKCEFYVNYYDENGNIVNEKYTGTFAEGREQEGMMDLDIDGVTESIPYYHDYDWDLEIDCLVLVAEGKEIYFEEL